jgi:osmotically-inducible protein OsmY
MIVEDVLEHLFRTAPPKVEVTVTDGVVTLAGTLESPAHARLAVHLARQVAGVVDVVDRLTFRVGDSPTG